MNNDMSRKSLWSSTEDKSGWMDGLAALQHAILRRAAALVRVGGVLVYATCTLRAEENEAVQHAFEAAHCTESSNGNDSAVRFRPAPLAEAWGRSVAKRVFGESDGGGRNSATLLPHIHGTDGFFIARWIRIQ